MKAALHSLLPRDRKSGSIKTLVDSFEYPRLGPGMMWEKTRDDICSLGCEVRLGEEVIRIRRERNRVIAVTTRNQAGLQTDWLGKSFIVSMPLRDCVLAFEPELSKQTIAAANRLKYRDFLTVALIVNRRDLFPDNWIYVHEASRSWGESKTSITGARKWCLIRPPRAWVWNIFASKAISSGR